MNILFSALKAVLIIFATLFLFSSSTVFAYQIEVLPETPVVPDFVVGPGKTELFLKPGETRVINLIVTNRMGDERIFSLDVEDFTGSRNLEETFILLGQERGPYSLRDYLHFNEKDFVLRHGERATVPVRVSIPPDAEPGGRYGSVIVSTISKPDPNTPKQGSTGASAIVARIGTLFFVRTPGDIKEEGLLREFSLKGDKTYLTKGPATFHLLFENNGSVHLTPYGEISIKNMVGAEVGKISVDPWFVLPDAVRLREVVWPRAFLFGKYTATASIFRGYGEMADTKTISFIVIPWAIIVGVFAAAFALFFILRFLFSRFEIRKKPSI